MTQRIDKGWDHPGSPFHAGEKAVQNRLGVAERMEKFGSRVIRPWMPEQHREFYESVPFIVMGGVDTSGYPAATILASPTGPGFIQSADDTHLAFSVLPGAADPLATAIADGSPIGLLGIEFVNRRRNRVNGRISQVSDRGWTLTVDQSFGNCPQYIQAREWSLVDKPEDEALWTEINNPGIRELIQTADTFFIATASPSEKVDSVHGVDVSHRGGRPGFVHIDDHGNLLWPDFVGNFHFNTLGNLELNDRAGLVFADFNTGDLVHIRGRAHVIWEGVEVDAFEGAERIVRFIPENILQRKAALPLRWSAPVQAIDNSRTGDWQQVTLARKAQAMDSYESMEVVSIYDESATIRSLQLRPTGVIYPWKAGQHLPLRLRLPDGQTAIRTYTLSTASNTDAYRISVKREPEGLASGHLHKLKIGDTIEALPPRGDFTLDATRSPVVLLSAGVGITPMIAMLEHLVAVNAAGRGTRRTWFIHSARNAAELAFGKILKQWAQEHEWLTVHLRLSQPDTEDTISDSVGRIDDALLKSLLPLDHYQSYLCGPGGFMSAMQNILTAMGVPADRIHSEAFGPSSMPAQTEVDPATLKPATVTFSRSGRNAEWSPDAGSLLELAESTGLQPPFGCRAGSCGTCRTAVNRGKIAGDVKPDALICTSYPQGDLELDL